MKNKIVLLSLFLGLGLAASSASAHCQIPCGIYGDDNVYGELMTDVETIQKSMNEINRLSKDLSENPHQLVRWINNKELHAQKIQDTISAYYLAQRIKLDWKQSDSKRYQKLVNLAHEITVLAMKCKQDTNLKDVDSLHDALHAFQASYSGK